MTRISRRRFATSAAAFASIAILPARARAADFTYKFGHDMPLNHPLNTAFVQMWKAVERETNGRLVVQTYANNQLGSDPAALTQIRSGAMQFTCLSGAVIAGVVPVTQIENLPFAFKTPAEVFRAMDGSLGGYLRKEMETKGIAAPFSRMFDLGFRQVTSSTKPIRTADDFNGFKIRTPPSRIFVDVFKTLGAQTASINVPEMYAALQTHVVDGQETPYSVIETLKFYEVQKYLSITNHIWAGWWLIASPEAWKALPSDIQATVMRNAEKYALQERREVALFDAALLDKLQRQGMTVNRADVGTIKRKLQAANFYKTWQGEFGNVAWDLLENNVGRLA